MKVVILCGGKGTRLREETEFRPKPMVPVGSQPILWHIMKTYAHYGFKEFVLCLGYKGDVIKDYFLNYGRSVSDITVNLGKPSKTVIHNSHTEEDWTVTLANTGEETMTGGRVKIIEKYVDGDVFMLTYGDGVGDVDINALLKFHKKHGKIGTVTGVRPPGRFGEMGLARNAVTEFNEKPQASGGRINGGYFVFNRSLFRHLKSDPALIFEQQPLRTLAAKRELMCFEHDGFWQPMDTFREFELLNKLWNEGKAPWKVW